MLDTAPSESARERRCRELLDAAAPEIADVRCAFEIDWGPYDSLETGLREEATMIIEKLLRAWGRKVTDAEVAALVEDALAELETAEQYTYEQCDFKVHARTGWGPPGDYKLLGNSRARKTWELTYRRRPIRRLSAHGGRHRRAPGLRSRRSRRHGSRRAGGVRTGQDPGELDPDHDQPVVRAIKRRAVG